MTSLAAVTNYTAPAWGADKTMEDLAYALGGAINIDGNDFTAHTGQLTLDKSAGHSFRLYAASGTSRDVPNNPINGAISPVTNYRYWAASGTSYGNALHATIDPDYYDNGGVRTAVPSGKWTIQRVYYFSGSASIIVSYGQSCFDTLDAAKAAANTQVVVFSDLATRMFHGGLLRARIYVQQGATDLSGAYVERMTAFVGGGAGGGGGTVVDHATLAHLDYAGAGHTGFVPDTVEVAGQRLTGNVTVYPSAIPQDANYKFVNDTQISNWNSAASSAHSHSNKVALDNYAGAVVLSAGTLAATSGTVVFSNSNGLAFGMSGNTVTGSYTVPTQTALSFSNTNGVSFGVNAGTVTASVQTNYLTTAMLSNAGSNFLNVGTTGATNASITLASNGLSVSVGNYLTTAMASNAGTKFLNVGTTGGTNASVTLNSNGLSISVGNYLTTARASNDGLGTVTALTGNGVLMTANSAGLSLNVPAFLTTALASNASTAFAATGFSSTTTAGAAIVGTHNTAGLSLGVPAFLTTAQPVGAYLTTAMASGAGSNFVAASGAFSGTNISGTIGSNGISLSAAAPSGGGAGTGFSSTTTAGAAIVGTLSTNGISLGIPAFLTAAVGGAGFAAQGSGTYSQNTGTIQFAASNGITFGLTNNQMTASHNGLTTAMASNASTAFAGLGFTDATTTGTDLLGTLGTNGLSILIPAFLTTAQSPGNYLTTAMASNAGSVFVAASATVAGTNISATIASNGMSFSAPNPGGGAGATLSTWYPWFPASTSSQTMGALGTSTASAMVFPFIVVDAVAFNCINLLVSMSFVSSTAAGSQSITSRFGIFSNNAGTLSLISSNSMSFAISVSSVSATLSYPTGTDTTGYAYGTVSASATAQAQSLFGTAGSRIVQLCFSNSMSLDPGMYWLGLHQRQSTTSNAAGLNTALVGNAMNGTSGVGAIGFSTAAFSASTAYHLGAHGVFTSTGLANHSGTNLPSTMALTGFNNNLNVNPLFSFLST
jgi:hypothetical protein